MKIILIQWKKRKKYYGQGDHVRIYGRNVVDRIIGAGFKVSLYSWEKYKDLYQIKNVDIVKKFTDEERNKYGFHKETLYLYVKNYKVYS